MKHTVKSLLIASVLTMPNTFAATELRGAEIAGGSSQVTICDLPVERLYDTTGTVLSADSSAVLPSEPFRDKDQLQLGFMDMETIRAFAEVDEYSPEFVSLSDGARAVVRLWDHQFTPKQLTKIHQGKINSEEAATLEKIIGYHPENLKSDQASTEVSIPSEDSSLVILMLALSHGVTEANQESLKNWLRENCQPDSDPFLQLAHAFTNNDVHIFRLAFYKLQGDKDPIQRLCKLKRGTAPLS